MKTPNVPTWRSSRAVMAYVLASWVAGQFLSAVHATATGGSFAGLVIRSAGVGFFAVLALIYGYQAAVDATRALEANRERSGLE